MKDIECDKNKAIEWLDCSRQYRIFSWFTTLVELKVLLEENRNFKQQIAEVKEEAKAIKKEKKEEEARNHDLIEIIQIIH